ncbi:unnamed protein product [Pseudo-nitzschia multistriata]|uniref:RxLR effector protein n=1 Tax=Pseudo-nitzschia multistriata TaxID=183589 RepID=A0A448ZLW6_9STRA|nr:unnamed protein product [Pseudo-nitzschia multistriata]
MKNAFTLQLAVSLIAAILVLEKSDIKVEGFSIGSRTTVPLRPSSSLLLKTRQPSSGNIATRPPSLFRVKDAKSEDTKDVVNENGMNNFQGICKMAATKCATQFVRFWFKSRRSVLTICGALMFWIGAAGVHTPASQASSVSSSMTKNIFSSSLDQMVDSYVKGHMFDDDAYDPVESIYKEAMNDRLEGTHPRDLKETTSSVLGQDVIKAERKGSGSGVSGLLMKSVGLLQKQGLSEMQAIGLLAGTIVFGFPAAVLGLGMQIGNRSRRSMNKVMKNRYGETYSVDATEKVEDDVDIPDDDDDDDDEE